MVPSHEHDTITDREKVAPRGKPPADGLPQWFTIKTAWVTTVQVWHAIRRYVFLVGAGNYRSRGQSKTSNMKVRGGKGEEEIQHIFCPRTAATIGPVGRKKRRRGDRVGERERWGGGGWGRKDERTRGKL